MPVLLLRLSGLLRDPAAVGTSRALVADHSRGVFRQQPEMMASRGSIIAPAPIVGAFVTILGSLDRGFASDVTNSD